MSAATGVADPRSPAASVRALFRDRPLIPLIGLLAVLVGII